jgi:signal transduction histidine kinase
LTSTVGDRHVDDWDPAIHLHEGPVPLGELFVSAGDVGPSSRTAFEQLTSVSTAAMATLRLQRELDQLYATMQAANRELAASRRRLIDAAQREHEEMRLLVREQVEPDVAHLRQALTTAPHDGATPARTDDLVDAANRIASTIRSIARGVLPSVLSDHGLVAAVRADLRRVDADVVFEVDPRLESERLATEVETVAYLCCRAVLRDADRSLANSIAVRIGRDDDVVRIDAQHRGRRRPTERAGTALTTARDRVHSLGGVAAIIAADETVGLHAELPITQPAVVASPGTPADHCRR